MSNKFKSFFESYAEAEGELGYYIASENINKKIEVVPTGSLLLDDALSCGGLPKGRIIQFYGSGGSGKTLMAIIAIKNAQAQDPESYQVFIDAEGTFSEKWAMELGCDISRIIVVEKEQAANGRRCFEMLLGVPKEDAKSHVLKGKSKEGLLDKICKKEINVNIIVLDSLGAIIPPGEDTSAIGKMNMSLLSRFLTPTFRKLILEVGKADIPFIVINHKKDSMDMYGPDHTFTGGNTYNHSLSANIYFESVMRKDAQILDEKDNKIGHTIRATIEKSKFGPHPRKCEFKVNFNIGVVDIHEEIAELAVEYDVVKKPSSVTHEYKDQKWVGLAKFQEGIKSDPALAEELTKEIAIARDNKNNKKLPHPVIEKSEDDLLEGLVSKTKKAKNV